MSGSRLRDREITRECRECLVGLPIVEFSPNPKGKRGWDSVCKACKRAANRAAKDAEYRRRCPRDNPDDLGPDGKFLDQFGNDWSWAFVAFADVPRFPGYKVGTNGSVWSEWGSGFSAKTRTGRWKRIALRKVHHGYWKCGLSRDGKLHHFHVHRLMGISFLGEHGPGWHVCHNDGNGSNNRLGNLRWDTPKGNMSDKVRHGTHQAGERHARAKIKDRDIPDIRRLISLGVPGAEIAERYGVSKSAIYCIKRGKTWCHV